MTKKQLELMVHPYVKKHLLNYAGSPNEWLEKQIKLYQENIKMPPIPNYTKERYQPRIKLEILDELEKIPGKTLSDKFTNLYFNEKARKEKERRRRMILQKYFIQ